MLRVYKAYKNCKVRVAYDFKTALFIQWFRTVDGGTESMVCLVNTVVCVVQTEQVGNGHHHMTPAFVAVSYGDL